MSVKEVIALRKEGRLEEAYRMARTEWETNRDDPWLQTSLFWTLRDKCCALCNEGKMQEAREHLEEMQTLLPSMKDENGIGARVCAGLLKRVQFGADVILAASAVSKTDPVAAFEQTKEFIVSPGYVDATLHEDLGWILYRYMLAERDKLPSLEIRKLLNRYIHLHNKRPSILHSSILNFALRFSNEHEDFHFYRFFLLWNPAQMRKEDLCDSFGGQTYPSLVSRVCRQLADYVAEVDVETLCREIDLPKDELLELLREAVFWKLFHLKKDGNMCRLFDVLDVYCEKFALYGSSVWHSNILSLAEHCMEGENVWRFLPFFKKWGCNNLADADWQETTDSNGHAYRPLAAKVAKKCYEVLKASRRKDMEQIEWVSAFYDKVLGRIGKDEWLLRNRAILYRWQEEYDKSACIYKSLLLEMHEKYYLWSELADCVQDDERLKTALLSKALLIEKNEAFLGSVRLSLADSFLQQSKNQEAAYELNVYKQCHGQASALYRQLTGRLSNMGVTLSARYKPSYSEYALLADSYVFGELEFRKIILVGRHARNGKIRCVLTDGMDITLQVNSKRFPVLAKAQMGTVFMAKCYVDDTDGRIILLDLRNSKEKLWSGLPSCMGYVEYVNEVKKVLHIRTQQEKLVFCHFSDRYPPVLKGNYVSFHTYTFMEGEKKRVAVVALEKVTQQTVLPGFRSGIAIVDNVNQKKRLFHFMLNEKKCGGIIRFVDTDLRPEVGQYIHVYYYVLEDRKTNKPGVIVLYVEKYVC